MVLRMIDPEVLTPASHRAMRVVVLVWLLSMLAVTGALSLYVSQTQALVRCQGRQTTYDAVRSLVQPVTTAGFTGQVLRSREQINQDRTRQRVGQGARPTC